MSADDPTHATECSVLLGERQRRFLAAYREVPVIARAARLAEVHRASVYRWKADPGFRAALKAAADDFVRGYREKLLAADAARERWWPE
jgi:hypothetical protein